LGPARALHAELQELLAAALLQIELAGQLGADDARLARERARLLVRQALQASREALALLHPEPVEDLPGAIRRRAEALARREGRELRFSCALRLPEPPPQVAEALLAATTELVGNACRHAGGVAVHLALAPLEQGLTLIVRDRGLGFDPRQHGAPGSLARLRQRLQRLGLSLALESAPGHGVLAQVAWRP
jgi:signal transduction histidine kinase